MTIFNEAALLVVAINNNQQMQIGDYGSAEAAKPLGDVGKLASRPPLKPSQGRTPCIFPSTVRYSNERAAQLFLKNPNFGTA
jgi:hypothetical protein